MSDEPVEKELRNDGSFGFSERLAFLILIVLLFAIAASFIYQTSPTEGVLTVGAAGLILAAVWHELISPKRVRENADCIIARANAQIAEYAYKAELAKFELEQLRSKTRPRMIDGVRFSRALEGKATASVELVFPKEDGEAYFLARQFFGLLREAGWQVAKPVPIASNEIPRLLAEPLHVAPKGVPAGVSVTCQSGASGNLDLFGNLPGASPIASIFNALAETFGDASEGGAEADVPNIPPSGVVRIVIGQKP